MAWISENWDSLLAAWGALTALATIVVGLTPTKEDDKWLAKVLKAIQPFSVLKKDKSK